MFNYLYCVHIKQTSLKLIKYVVENVMQLKKDSNKAGPNSSMSIQDTDQGHSKFSANLWLKF